MRRRDSRDQRRVGAVAPLVALLLLPLLAMIAFAVDIGYIASTKTQLQAAADAAAVAAATRLITNYLPTNQPKATAAAERFAEAHWAGDKAVSFDPATDIEFGYWDKTERKFKLPKLSEEAVKVNAVKVTLRRDAKNANGQLPLFFGPVLGVKAVNVSAESIAYVGNPVITNSQTGIGTRFLIDDEMLDADEPAIINLAKTLGKTADQLLTAKNPKSTNPSDWFLDLPAGARLELPTGQVGDEGLFDLTSNASNSSLPQYPFSAPVDHVKFLKYNETSDTDPISLLRALILPKSKLDPVTGVGRFNQPGMYQDLPNPNFVHVSPVWKSDISAQDGVNKADAKAGPDINGDGKVDGFTTNSPVVKGVSALGFRRSLLAFRILAYKLNPSKPYPYLPNLVIEIVDPATINLETVVPVLKVDREYTAGGVSNVRLVK